MATEGSSGPNGVEVFRRLYTAIGLGPLVWATRLPIVSGLLDWGYRFFARNRLRWTGRCSDSGGNCRISTTVTESGGSCELAEDRVSAA